MPPGSRSLRSGWPPPHDRPAAPSPHTTTRPPTRPPRSRRSDPFDPTSRRMPRLAALATAASAQTLPSVPDLDYERFTLGNGLTLLVH